MPSGQSSATTSQAFKGPSCRGSTKKRNIYGPSRKDSFHIVLLENMLGFWEMAAIREDLGGLLCREMNADKRPYSKWSDERSREKFISPNKECSSSAACRHTSQERWCLLINNNENNKTHTHTLGSWQLEARQSRFWEHNNRTRRRLKAEKKQII